MSTGQLAAVTGGALLVVSSVRQRPALAPWIAALGMSCIAGALFCGPSSQLSLRLKQRRQAHDPIDQVSEDSFPASDPPSSMQAD